jgi:DNA-damage-inducible protein J
MDLCRSFLANNYKCIPHSQYIIDNNGDNFMSKSAMVRARLEPDLKDHAETIFHRLGLNTTQAITMFYKQVELQDGLPFDEVILSATTKHTMEATDTGRDLVVCKDANDMFNKLEI